MISGGVDFVTVHGKLGGEALQRTGSIVKEERNSFKRKEVWLWLGRMVLEGRIAAV